MDAGIVSSNQPDQKLLARLRKAQTICCAIAALVATMVLFGWMAPGVAALLPTGWAHMNIHGAVAIALSSIGLLLLRNENKPRQLLAGRICVAVVLLLAVAAIVESVGGRALDLDNLLAPDSSATMQGRMPFQAAVCLIMFASTLIAGTRQPIVAAVTFIVLVGMVMVMAAACVFGIAQLFGQSFMPVSLQALLCMLLLVFAAGVHISPRGLLSVFIGVGIGSQIARFALPFALLMPFTMVSVSEYSIMAGWLSASYAAAWSAAANAILMFGFVVLTARKINALERDLRNMSLTDELTQINNRRGFYLLGEHSWREGRRATTPLTVLYFDLDGLKTVNDTLGHDVGSQLVSDFAHLLSANFRSNDVVARVGGDEFAIVTRTREAEFTGALARLDEAIAAANATGKPYTISYSVGEATLDPDKEEPFAELVDRADAVMYLRKRAKKEARAAAAKKP